MANADQIKALIQSHADGDDERFYSVALQVAASAARGGRSLTAQDLKKLIDSVRLTSPVARSQGVAGRPASPVEMRGDLGELLGASHPETTMSDLVLAAPVRSALD